MQMQVSMVCNMLIEMKPENGLRQQYGLLLHNICLSLCWHLQMHCAFLTPCVSLLLLKSLLQPKKIKFEIMPQQ